MASFYQTQALGEPLVMNQLEAPALPRQLYRAAKVREFDRIAIEEYGIPGFELMRRAGRAAFGLLQARWPEARRIAVFCGAGNNGGDGYIVAARAAQLGLDVRLYMLVAAEALQGDARSAYQLALEAGVEPRCWDGDSLGDNDVIVDGLLGTGISGAVREHYGRAIEAINQTALPVLALDILFRLSASSKVCSAQMVEPVLGNFISMIWRYQPRCWRHSRPTVHAWMRRTCGTICNRDPARPIKVTVVMCW